MSNETAAPTVFDAPIRVESGLYFGRKDHIKSGFLQFANINTLVNLTGFDIDREAELHDYLSGVAIVNMSLMSDELMPEEMERFRNKTLNIVDKILQSKSAGNVFVVCNTGVNKSPVIIGQYLLRTGSMSPCQVLTQLHEYSKQAKTALLTNTSFKKILHDRKKLSPECKCWSVVVYNYRSQDKIENDSNSTQYTV